MTGYGGGFASIRNSDGSTLATYYFWAGILFVSSITGNIQPSAETSYMYDVLAGGSGLPKVFIVENKKDAEDIVSDLFQNLAENPDLSHIKSLKSYLYKSIHNKSLKFLRHVKILKKYTQEAQGNLDFFLPYDDADPLSKLISEETVCKIQQAIDSLPPKCKGILVLAKPAFW